MVQANTVSTLSAQLHQEAVVVDCHHDLIQLVAHERYLRRPGSFATRWVPELRSGGVDVQVMPMPGNDLHRCLLLTEYLKREVQECPGEAAICRTGTEVDATVADGKIALVVSLEGCGGVGTDVELFGTFFDVGVRMASFTHFGRTQLADGSDLDPAGSRLTRFGETSLRELERLGILMDVSHLSLKGTEHVLELATRPVIASHSSAGAVYSHHRNLPDELLRAIAGTGGVIGVNFVPGFIDPRQPTAERVVDHIEHMLNVVGPEHVGIGPDFVRELYELRFPQGQWVSEGLPPTGPREQIATSGDLPLVTETMLKRGISEDVVHKVLGDNFLRVFRQVMGVPGGS